MSVAPVVEITCAFQTNDERGVRAIKDLFPHCVSILIRELPLLVGADTSLSNRVSVEELRDQLSKNGINIVTHDEDKTCDVWKILIPFRDVIQDGNDLRGLMQQLRGDGILLEDEIRIVREMRISPIAEDEFSM